MGHQLENKSVSVSVSVGKYLTKNIYNFPGLSSRTPIRDLTQRDKWVLEVRC